jgi:uncharacterized protein
MKHFAGAIIVFFIALFAYTKLAGPIPFTVTQVTTNKSDTFTVSGEGKVTVPPDIALISAGVQAQGKTVIIVQDQLNKAVSAVTAAVKKAGVAAADLQTTNYNINPTYDYTAGTQRITGYQASSNLTIKVRAIDTANTVIDAATQAGANQIGGISFDVDNKTKAQNDARKLAVTDAKTKAENAAKIAGFTLGRIINYSEDFGNSPRPVPMFDKAVAVGSGVSAAPTEVSTGSTDITVTVSLSFEIR